jgi:hypothetical protein
MTPKFGSNSGVNFDAKAKTKSLMTELDARFMLTDRSYKIFCRLIMHALRSAYEMGREEENEECAKITEITPVAILRSQSHEGLRLSIADAIRSRIEGVIRKVEG